MSARYYPNHFAGYDPPQPLRPRDYRIIELVAAGHKNAEVGAILGTTEHVIKNYLRVIYDSLGVWSRVELALWYERRKWEQEHEARHSRSTTN